MKTFVEAEKQFRPVKVTFTLESQEEVDKFHGFLNVTSVADFLGTKQILDVLESLNEVVTQEGADKFWQDAKEYLKQFTR